MLPQRQSRNSVASDETEIAGVGRSVVGLKFSKASAKPETFSLFAWLLCKLETVQGRMVP
jgi:hypothetical protein